MTTRKYKNNKNVKKRAIKSKKNYVKLGGSGKSTVSYTHLRAHET